MRVYAGMWVMAVAFALNAIVQPYASPLLLRLETTSLLSISISLNLSLLFGFWEESESPAGYYAVLSAIMAINVLVLLGFLVGLVIASKEKLLTLARENPARWGFIARWFQVPIAVLEHRTAALQAEVAALRAQLTALNLRMTTIGYLVGRPAAQSSYAHDVKLAKAFDDYDKFTRTAGVRMERFSNPDAQILLCFELEKAVLLAEQKRAAGAREVAKRVHSIFGRANSNSSMKPPVALRRRPKQN